MSYFAGSQRTNPNTNDRFRSLSPVGSSVGSLNDQSDLNDGSLSDGLPLSALSSDWLTGKSHQYALDYY